MPNVCCRDVAWVLRSSVTDVVSAWYLYRLEDEVAGHSEVQQRMGSVRVFKIVPQA